MKQLVLLITTGLLLACGQKKEYDSQPKKAIDFKTSIKRGEIVYNNLCITCHLPNGKGVPRAFPPLAGSDYLKNNQDLSIKSVKYGMSGEIRVNGESYNSVMANMGLKDQEVADVMNFINNAWGNNYGEEISIEKVSKITP